MAESGKLTLLRNYGLANVEWHEPTTPDTVFRVGSITKQFAAAGMLLLAQENKLSPEDRLAHYFPEFPRSSEVTLRQLLNHTSGIRNYLVANVIAPAPEEMQSPVGRGRLQRPKTTARR